MHRPSVSRVQQNWFIDDLPVQPMVFSHLQLLVEGVDNVPWVSRLQIIWSLLSVPNQIASFISSSMSLGSVHMDSPCRSKIFARENQICIEYILAYNSSSSSNRKKKKTKKACRHSLNNRQYSMASMLCDAVGDDDVLVSYHPM